MTGAITRIEDFAADDYRRESSRFQGENFQHNMALVNKVAELAATRGCTAGQPALAIPGTKRRAFLEQNVGALQVHVSAAELAAIEAIFPIGAANGGRYTDAGMLTVNG